MLRLRCYSGKANSEWNLNSPFQGSNNKFLTHSWQNPHWRNCTYAPPHRIILPLGIPPIVILWVVRFEFQSPPSPSPVEIVFTTDKNYFYACWKLLLRCLLGKVETESGCSRDSSLHFVPLWVRGEGCHPWSLAFIRMARLKSVVIRRICVICVHPAAPCILWWIDARSTLVLQKMFFNTFWLSSVCVTLYIFLQKKSLNYLVRIKIRLTFASAFRKEAVLKKRSLKDLDMNKQVVQD